MSSISIKGAARIHDLAVLAVELEEEAGAWRVSSSDVQSSIVVSCGRSWNLQLYTWRPCILCYVLQKKLELGTRAVLMLNSFVVIVGWPISLCKQCMVSLRPRLPEDTTVSATTHPHCLPVLYSRMSVCMERLNGAESVASSSNGPTF